MPGAYKRRRMTDAVIDGRVGCSNQKMVELRTQRKTELWDIRLWAVLEAARQFLGEADQGKKYPGKLVFFFEKNLFEG